MLRNTRSKGNKPSKTPSTRRPTKVTGKASSPQAMQDAHNKQYKGTAR